MNELLVSSNLVPKCFSDKSAERGSVTVKTLVLGRVSGLNAPESHEVLLGLLAITDKSIFKNNSFRDNYTPGDLRYRIYA